MARPGISTKKIPQKNTPPRPEILETPRIYPENAPKIPKKYPQNTKNAHFWYFGGIFSVFSWGSRISGRGVFFRYFSRKFRVGPSRGSVAGRGVLNTNGTVFILFQKVLLNVRRNPSIITTWQSHHIAYRLHDIKCFQINFAATTFRFYYTNGVHSVVVPSQQEKIHARSFVLRPKLRIQYTYAYVNNSEHIDTLRFSQILNCNRYKYTYVKDSLS